MAKATPLQKSRPGLPLAVLAAVGVVFGVAIHIQDLHRAPGHNAAVKKLNGQQLQARLGVDYGSYKPLKLLFILVNFFEHALRERTSVGLLLALYSILSPMFLTQAIDSLKIGRSKAIAPLAFILVGLIGQLITVGAATPLFWVPLYALSRYRESGRKTQAIHPLPSPSALSIKIVNVLSAGVGSTVFAMLGLPNGSPAWVLSCIIFQFFPFINLPLALLPASRQESSKQQNGTVVPRLAAAKAHKFQSLATVPLWWAGLAVALPGFIRDLKVGQFNNDGAHLLFWDCLGMLGAQYLLVSIDSYADEARFKSTAERVQPPRSFAKDLAALPRALLLGPGNAIATYYQQREERAENARLGLKIK